MNSSDIDLNRLTFGFVIVQVLGRRSAQRRRPYHIQLAHWFFVYARHGARRIVII